MKKIKLLFLLPALALCSCVLHNGECDIHTDVDGNGRCDVCGVIIGDPCEHVDGNADGICDDCGAYYKDTSKKEEEEKKEVITSCKAYLCLTSVGRLNGSAGERVAELHLEHVVVFEDAPGANLPDGSQVSHINSNCSFKEWVAYEGKGAPTVYKVLPEQKEIVLYAVFEANA